jgi:hypothetical protein
MERDIYNDEEKNPAVMIPRLKNKKEILGRKYEDVLC